MGGSDTYDRQAREDAKAAREQAAKAEPVAPDELVWVERATPPDPRVFLCFVDGRRLTVDADDDPELNAAMARAIAGALIEAATTPLASPRVGLAELSDGRQLPIVTYKSRDGAVEGQFVLDPDVGLAFAEALVKVCGRAKTPLAVVEVPELIVPG